MVQERRATDDAYRVSPLDLFVSLAEVEVEGLDPAQLIEVRQLAAPGGAAARRRRASTAR